MTSKEAAYHLGEVIAAHDLMKSAGFKDKATAAVAGLKGLLDKSRQSLRSGFERGRAGVEKRKLLSEAPSEEFRELEKILQKWQGGLPPEAARLARKNRSEWYKAVS